MPYKDKKKQKKAMQKIMREHRKNRNFQQAKLREAIDMNRLDLAKQIMNSKPKMFQQTWQDLFGKKQTTRKSRK